MSFIQFRQDHMSLAIKQEEIHCLQAHDVKETVHELTTNSNVACFSSQGTGVKIYNWSGVIKHISFNKTVKSLAMFGSKLYCGCTGYSILEKGIETHQRALPNGKIKQVFFFDLDVGMAWRLQAVKIQNNKLGCSENDDFEESGEVSTNDAMESLKNNWPPRGRLSERMSEHGNLWRKIWNDAPALPASEQKPLLDPNREGEKIYLHRWELYAALDVITMCSCHLPEGDPVKNEVPGGILVVQMRQDLLRYKHILSADDHYCSWQEVEVECKKDPEGLALRLAGKGAVSAALEVAESAGLSIDLRRELKGRQLVKLLIADPLNGGGPAEASRFLSSLRDTDDALPVVMGAMQLLTNLRSKQFLAIVFYELAFDFNPHCAEACNNLGVIYEDCDNLDKAVEFGFIHWSAIAAVGVLLQNFVVKRAATRCWSPANLGCC
ncbi:unnamed protein product [Camellia sinensis]